MLPAMRGKCMERWQSEERTPTPLDSNHNDIIDPEEIAKAAEALKKLDKNGDGKPSPEEYRPRMPNGRMPGR